MTRDGFETESEQSKRTAPDKTFADYSARIDRERSEREKERCWTQRRIQFRQDNTRLASFEAEMLKSPDIALAGVCG